MKTLLTALALFTSTFFSHADTPVAAKTGDFTLTWQVDGVTREGLLHIPESAKTKPAPIIFAWHGHGGTMRHALNSFGYDKLWPEAISVYLQGLNTPGRLVDPEGKKPGWQGILGDQGDRDLKFFDIVLAQLKRDYKIDERRIYSTGHSNGGGFTYLLWQHRGDVFAAMAPSAAFLPPARGPQLKPLPVLHVAGETDPLVKFSWQKLMMDRLIKLNDCGAPHPWGDAKFCTEYTSPKGHPVVTCIHPGDHTFFKDAPALIVKFFKSHAKPDAAKL
jgi:polyhydroxybutyrate depolymerase